MKRPTWIALSLCLLAGFAIRAGSRADETESPAPRTLIVFHDSSNDPQWLAALANLSDRFRIVSFDTSKAESTALALKSTRRDRQSQDNNRTTLVTSSPHAQKAAKRYLEIAKNQATFVELPQNSDDLLYLSEILNTFVNASKSCSLSHTI